MLLQLDNIIPALEEKNKESVATKSHSYSSSISDRHPSFQRTEAMDLQVAVCEF